MRILFTGGGTGGHIFPIIAIKESFQDAHDFYYLGPDSFAKENLTRLDSRRARQAGFKTKFILAGKLRRYFSFLAPIDFIKTIIGIIQSFICLFFWMPDVIFSKGGYGSFPVVFAGWIYRIPIVLHDSDAVPGLANRKMAKFAKRIILSFAGSEKHFKNKYQKKIIVIGNPIRKELFCEGQACLPAGRGLFKINSSPSTALGASKPVVLILGGSQGAQKINETVINILPRLLEIAEVIHGCGQENFKSLEKETQKSPDYHLYSFLNAEQMKHALALADLIINRAGAGSIFEIAALGKPSILIPLPNSAQNHQRENAYEFAKISGAIVLDQENLTPNLFLEQITNLLSNPQKLSEMSQKAKSFYNPATAELIRDEILKIA